MKPKISDDTKHIIINLLQILLFLFILYVCFGGIWVVLDLIWRS